MRGVTGSAIADAAMKTRLLGVQMLKRGFSKGYAAAVPSVRVAARADHSAGIGFILYGTVGQVRRSGGSSPRAWSPALHALGGPGRPSPSR